MHWDQIAANLKQLGSKILSAPSAAAGRAASRNISKAATALWDREQDQPKMTPYSPDDRYERSTFSLHISC
jgi:hypothetical protein